MDKRYLVSFKTRDNYGENHIIDALVTDQLDGGFKPILTLHELFQYYKHVSASILAVYQIQECENTDLIRYDVCLVIC